MGFLKIIGVELNTEVMRSFHSFVHHKAHRNRCFCPRINGRRTDDSAGRSTPFDKFNWRFIIQDSQHLVANIAYPKDGFYLYIERHIAEVNDFRGDGDTRRASHFRNKVCGYRGLLV